MIKKISIAILFCCTIKNAETFYVPEDFNTIQSAINSSANGDSILVSPGLYTETINFMGKSIVISSMYLLESDSLIIGSTIIDAENSGSVVTFSSGEDSLSQLHGFTLQGGAGNEEDPDDNGSFYNYGGGIYCFDSDPIIRDCIIQNNIANEGGGGGIFCYNSSPILSGCTITNNLTDDVGGGLYSRAGSSPSLFNCIFFGNSAEFGAGCYLRNESIPTMEYVTFTQNVANNSGGGIGLKDDADLQGNHIFITENIAEGLGGGLYVNNADPQMSYSLIADNISSSGAGAYIRNTSIVDFTNLTIANNSAGLYGNGVYMRDNVTVNLLNTIIWGNSSSQIYFRSEGTEVELSVFYSLVQDGEDGIESNENGDINWGTGNLDGEPYFCSADNYYIRENSPCIDGGLSGGLVGCFGVGCGPVNLGPVWYVDINGDNANDGSLDAPFGTISRAINASSDNGDTIRLYPGVYTEEIDFNDKDIVLESRAFEIDNPNLISETYFGSGPVGGTCLILSGASNNNVTIRGISFRGGSDPFGGGLVVTNCSPTFSDIIIEGNNAEIGGGIYIADSDAILKNTTIRNNSANLGGGIYISNGDPIFENTTVESNVAYWGGGLYIDSASPSIEDCKIKQNDAFIEGAGLYQNGGVCEVEWTSFENNNGYDYGGAIVAYQATLDLSQITFAGNIAGVGSVFSFHSSVVSINNSIIWGNQGGIFYCPASSGLTSLEINYSDIEGGEDVINSFPNILFTTGGGIINVDPQYCDIENNQFNLENTSVCFSASDSSTVIGAYNLPCGVLDIYEEPITNEFHLLDNYPNPFNPFTTITYVISDFGDYSLRIYNLNGQLVKILSSGYGNPGKYTKVWDSTNESGTSVASGVYIYRLETNNNILIKKMMLIK